MILCFSGTGNGLYISGRIAEATGDEIISLNDRIKTADYSSITAERLIFVVPTYGWRIPRVVEQWMRPKHGRSQRAAYRISKKQHMS